MFPHKTYFNWSSGKDASMALYLLKQNPQFNVDRLITTINTQYNRVSMHGLRIDLLHAQAESIGLPLEHIELPAKPVMETYNKIMSDKVSKLKNEGFTHCAFGDIFLEDLKKYREDQLSKYDVKAVFPLWKKNTSTLIKEFIALGFKAVTVCVDGSLLDESFVGRELDEEFLHDLPENVDPCGENGEFHTFCYDGPIFKHPIPFKLGEKVYKTYQTEDRDYGLRFCDLI